MNEATEESVSARMRRIVATTLLHRQSLVRRRRPSPFHEQQHFYDFHEAHNDHAQPVGFGGVLPFLGILIKMALLSTLLMTAALITYLAFYYWAMPVTVACERLHFDYSAAAATNLLTHHTTHSKLEVDRVLPHASVDLFARHSAWDAFHDSVLPRAKVDRHLLHPQQPYFIEASFLMPDSKVNQQAGMFNVVTDLISSNGTMLASSRRSTRYPHRTPWVANVQRAVWLLPILTGAAEEVTRVTVPSFRHYVESPDLPLQHVHVNFALGKFKVPVEVLTGQIHIGEELSWFQELLREWFFTCLFLGTHLFAAFHYLNWQLLRALGSWLRHRHTTPEGFDEEPPCELNLDDISLPGPEGVLGNTPDQEDEELRSNNGSRAPRQSPQRQRQQQSVVVEDDEGAWEELRRGFGSRRSQSHDDDSFSTPLQGEAL